MLNLPGEAIVLEADFLNLLDRLDICLAYLKGNVRLPFHSSAIHLLIVDTEEFQRRRNLPHPIPTMPDAVNDLDQDVLCQHHHCARQRRRQQNVRQQRPVRNRRERFALHQVLDRCRTAQGAPL